MSQQEDDLRALAKIMDLLRASSIAVVVGNIYWFCRELVDGWRFHAETMKVLSNFNEACGMFHNPWNAKWWAVLFLGLSCFGSRGVKAEKIRWSMIWTLLSVGAVLFFYVLVDARHPLELHLYIMHYYGLYLYANGWSVYEQIAEEQHDG